MHSGNMLEHDPKDVRPNRHNKHTIYIHPFTLNYLDHTFLISLPFINYTVYIHNGTNKT
jgi:hypothetical protein